jgi:large subunit ribosomal protein L1
MAKASSPESRGSTAPADSSAPEPKQAKKPREPKTRTSPAAEKTAEADQAPGKAGPADRPAADKAASGEKAGPAEKAAPAEKGESVPLPGAKKKGKRPGVPPRRGKKLRNQIRQLQQKLQKEGSVSLKRALQMLKQMKRGKFDETVEVHMSLGIDTTQSDQMIRGSVALPHGLGKSKRVVVFCQGDNIGKARDAGADFAGSDDLIEKVQKENWLEFDVALATQDLMPKVSRLGKVLGPRGLMPSPKSGTVVLASGDVAAAVREFKAGKVEYRTDKGGNVHAGVGKISFDEDKLSSNIAAFVEQVRAAKPSGVKGNYIKSVTLKSTMSPGIRITM